MEYNKIISVTGLGGLFELVGSKSDGAIVRSLEDKSTKFVSSRSHHFSHLESIEVYTQRDNVNLVDVFKAMKASKETLPDHKNLEAVKKYFAKVFPEMDFDRVYASDMKKMVRWYHILVENEIDFTVEENAAETAEAPAEPVEEDKTPAKKAAKKKAAPKKEESATAEEKPKKKAAPKKKKTEE